MRSATGYRGGLTNGSPSKSTAKLDDVVFRGIFIRMSGPGLDNGRYRIDKDVIPTIPKGVARWHPIDDNEGQNQT